MPCQALCKGIEGEDCPEMYEAYKNMSRAVEVKKPQESQKAKAFWKMKAAKEAGEEYYDPTRELALWEEQLKDPIVALDIALKCVENSYWRFRPECLVEGCLAMAGVGFLQGLWDKPIWEGVWPNLDPMDSVCSRTASMVWNVPGKYGPHGELFSFLIQKEPATVPVGKTFSPFFKADIRTSPLLC